MGEFDPSMAIDVRCNPWSRIGMSVVWAAAVQAKVETDSLKLSHGFVGLALRGGDYHECRSEIASSKVLAFVKLTPPL